MFISRAEYQKLVTAAAAAEHLQARLEDTKAIRLTLAELRAQSAKERERELKLTEQLAQLRSSFEWLTTHVNRLERERAELFARVLNLQLPAMSLEREPQPSISPNQVVGRPAEDSYENSIPALQAAGGLFEDVGDEAASRLGVGHDDMGNVKWTR